MPASCARLVHAWGNTCNSSHEPGHDVQFAGLIKATCSTARRCMARPICSVLRVVNGTQTSVVGFYHRSLPTCTWQLHNKAQARQQTIAPCWQHTITLLLGATAYVRIALPAASKCCSKRPHHQPNHLASLDSVQPITPRVSSDEMARLLYVRQGRTPSECAVLADCEFPVASATCTA